MIITFVLKEHGYFFKVPMEIIYFWDELEYFYHYYLPQTPYNLKMF